MKSLSTSLAIWLILCNATQSANNSTNSISGNTSHDVLCGDSFDNANATGFFSFNPGILIPSRPPPPDATWAVTLLGGAPQNTSLDQSFWYFTGGVNYSDSLSLGYDVCAIYLEPLGILNNTDMRAQHDNGSCLTAFDGDCVTALQQQSEDYALQLVESPTVLPNSNLTADSLPGVCDSLAQMMTSALPKQCKQYMNNDEYLVYGKALTTNYASSGLSFGNTDICTVGPSNQPFNLVDGWNDNEDPTAPHEVYDRSSWTLLATLAVFMPVANARRTTSMNYAVSVLSCLGIQQYNIGSRVPDPAPQPTPVRFGSGGIGGGAIAGIFVGSVVGVGIVAAGIAFFWLRKRKTRRNSEASPPDVVYPEDKPPYAAVNPLRPAEFGDESTVQEIGTREPYMSELPDAAIRDPVELVGSTLYVSNEVK